MEAAKKAKEKKIEFTEALEKEHLTIEEILEIKKEMLLTIKARRQMEKVLSDYEESNKKKLSSQTKESSRKGIICWMLDLTEEAIKYLEDGSLSDGAGYFLALCYAETEQKEKAHKLFAEANKEFPNSPEVFSSYMHSLIKLGKSDDAWALLQKAKDKLGKHPVVLYFKGVQAEFLGEYRQSQEEYNKALELDGNYAPALFNLAYRYHLGGKLDEANEIYEKLRELKPPYANALINLGLVYEDKGNYQKALECYDSVLSMNPSHPRANLYRDDVKGLLSLFYDDSFKRKEQELSRLLGQPLSEFQIPTRAKNCLEELNIRSIGDLVKKTENDLMGCENFGRKTLTDIKELLARRGLTLSTETKTTSIDALLKSYISTEEPQKTDDVLNKPIFEIDWSARVRGSLTRLKIYTVGNLISRSEKDFMDMPNFGQTSLDEIKRRLSQLGLSLKQVE